MTIGLIFWILMVVWLAFSAWTSYSPGGPAPAWGGTILLFILFLLLGWGVFGAPIRG